MARAFVNGIGLEYLLEGEGRETVALLNGIAMSISHWKPVAARLVAAGYRVLMHDLRGQLLSDKPESPYSFEEHARDFAALLAELGLGRVHVAGTSYGAELGLVFARDFPGLCASLVSIDGVSEYDAVLGAAVESWKAAALCDPRVFYRTLLPWNYSAGYLEAHREDLARREDAIASLPRAWFEAFARLCDAFLAMDMSKDLGRIRCPCLALVAEKDILKHWAYSRVIAEGVPGARLEEIPGAGHALVVEKPDEVSEAIARFLSGLRG